jgi:hypothetical protein
LFVFEVRVHSVFRVRALIGASRRREKTRSDKLAEPSGPSAEERVVDVRDDVVAEMPVLVVEDVSE